jgi:hypothetical protein
MMKQAQWQHCAQNMYIQSGLNESKQAQWQHCAQNMYIQSGLNESKQAQLLAMPTKLFTMHGYKHIYMHTCKYTHTKMTICVMHLSQIVPIAMERTQLQDQTKPEGNMGKSSEFFTLRGRCDRSASPSIFAFPNTVGKRMPSFFLCVLCNVHW